VKYYIRLLSRLKSFKVDTSLLRDIKAHAGSQISREAPLPQNHNLRLNALKIASMTMGGIATMPAHIT
jgi:hypothetical protein